MSLIFLVIHMVMISTHCRRYQYVKGSLLSIKNIQNNRWTVPSRASARLCSTTRVQEEDHLFSSKVSFAEIGVSAELSNSLNELNFKWATPIQQMSYKAIHSGKDVVIGSETGSGKTLSYLLPLLDMMSSTDRSSDLYPYMVVLAPNKELVRQVDKMAQEVVTVFNKNLNGSAVVRIKAVTDLSNYWTHTHGDDTPSLLICTPKYLSNFIKGPTIFEPELFQSIRHVVLDEADMLLEGSYLHDVEQIFDALRLTRRQLVRNGDLLVHEKWTQFILSAATIPSFGLKSIQAYVKKRFPEASILRSDFLHAHHPCIVQNFIKSEEGIIVASTAHVTAVVDSLVKADHPQSQNLNLEQKIGHLNRIDYLVMIFLNTAVNAESFFNTLSLLGANCIQFHSALSSAEKEENLRSFTSGEIPIMVCTDSASRGLDLPAVRVVVQAEFALNVVQHLHRIGRGSRAGKFGKALNFYSRSCSELVESIIGMCEPEDNITLDNNAFGDSIEKSFSRKRGFRRNLKRNVANLTE